MTLPIAQLAGPADTERYRAVSSIALRTFDDEIRNDSRRSADTAVNEQRVLIKHFARTMARAAAQKGEAEGRGRLDAKQLKNHELDIVDALCDGFGIRNDDGTLRNDIMRNDAASFYPGELTVSTGRTIVQPTQRRAVLETLPRLAVPAWAEYVSDDYLGYTGSAGIYRSGQTSVLRADVEVAQKQQQMHTIHTYTRINWMESMFGSRSRLDRVARMAESARKAIETYLESALTNGIPGVSFQGLVDLDVAEYYSPVNYTPGSATIGAIYADLIAAAQIARQESEYRGGDMGEPNIMWLSPRIWDAIQPRNNLDSGGSMTGAQMLNQTLTQMGITTMVKATSLQAWKGEANRDAIIFGNTGDDEGIRQFVGLDAAPMRTATDLHGDETLWIARHGGCNLASAVYTSYASIQVRS